MSWYLVRSKTAKGLGNSLKRERVDPGTVRPMKTMKAMKKSKAKGKAKGKAKANAKK